MAKKILITGATGLIGHTAYLHLVSQPEKYEVYALDRSCELSERVPKDRTFSIPHANFFQCDLAAFDDVAKAVNGMDTVIHMGADASGSEWESVLQNNIIGAYNVFEACRRADVKRLIAASTIQVSSGYRELEPYKSISEKGVDDVPEKFPMVTSEMPAEPRNIYASSKVWSESLARTYAHVHGMSCIIIRPGWVVAEDKPRGLEGADIWCSQRDIAQLIECCIDAHDDVRFEIFWAMSDNKWRWVDIEHARRKVGYVPRDRAENSM